MSKPGRAAALVLAGLVAGASGELLSSSPAEPTPTPSRTSRWFWLFFVQFMLGLRINQ